jgi:hypothetical protein
MKQDAVLPTDVIAKVNFDSGFWFKHRLTFSTGKQNRIRSEDAGASKARQFARSYSATPKITRTAMNKNRVLAEKCFFICFDRDDRLYRTV